MALTTPSPMLYNIGFVDEVVKGDPKSMRIERQDFSDEHGNITHLQEIVNYLPGGKKTERYIYRADGALSCREVYEYANDGRLQKVKTFDQTDAEVCVTSLQLTDAGTEQVVVLDGTGKMLDHTIFKRDEAGRVLEATSTSERGQMSAAFQYDDQGRPTQWQLTFQGLREVTQRVEIEYLENSRVAFSLYGPEGTLLTQSEIAEDAAGREVSQLILTGGSAGTSKTIEQIESRDMKGNWTRKVLLKDGGSAEAPQPIAAIYRRISYY